MSYLGNKKRKIVLIYASVNQIRIFHRPFLIYAPVKHIRILQRQFDDAFSAQNLTKRIFLIKNRNLIFIEKLLNVSSLSDYWTVRLPDCWTTGPSDNWGVGL